MRSTPPSRNNSPHPQDVVTTRALIVWSAAAILYMIAITGRTSFGVAGHDAILRFQVDASRIAVFTAVQLGVYAFAQIPMGMLIDRFGPRKLLLIGAVIMGVGQILLGLTTSYGVAIGARVLIGAGDATAFLAVMRLLPYWFPLKKTPIFTQLSASIGQMGQFISAVPFLALLQGAGWTWAFVSLGAVGILIAIAAAVLVADSPEYVPSSQRNAKAKLRTRILQPILHPTTIHLPHLHWGRRIRLRMGLRTQIRKVGSQAVCWQAFFTHGTAMLPQLIFTMLWGVPLMTMGMGLSTAQVGLLLTVNTVSSVVCGPLMGIISARLGQKRDLAGVVIVVFLAAAWVIFFLPSQPRGFLAALVINVVTAGCAPISNYGFDYVREDLQPAIVATGTGLGNMGGFLAGMVTAQLMGFLLDFSSETTEYQWGDFRIAWLGVLGMWGLGMVGLFFARRRRLATARPAVRYVEQSEED
ncbi:MFS transporter [Corynebacterium uropygiale]|uniref:MFS transporter n=1 Tax=Corynebacterium uropygiale TaxID=1775911 RepID=A0A9X1U091_9CORY|nr:MFS transporter [Corynebacterium uropygiale]MCF4006228.1 MFS transporter [Corynebacterium uropygiale]